MSSHRGSGAQTRWGRVALACAAALVTVTTLVGGAVAGGDDTAAVARDAGRADAPAAVVAAETGSGLVEEVPVEAPAPAATPNDALPASSGAGRRVVFSQSRQRVWLVGSAGAVRRTYLVSGSVTDNLDPGSYEVYSRSERAWGIDDSGTMKWFVRFTRGDNAAIGFHDIPVDDGAKVQTVAQLGTPLSHGCIRQRRSDARALWAYAPVGTPVVVTA